MFANAPLTKLIRVPRRFILVASLALAILVAFGVLRLFKRLENKRVVKYIAVALLLVFMAVEFNFAPIPIYPQTPVPEVYKWLGEQPGQFSVAEFPTKGRNYGKFIRQVYGSIYHWKNLIVGYSGYQSPENIERIDRLNENFPGTETLEELKTLDVKYIILFEDRFDKAVIDRIQQMDSLTEVKRYGVIAVYELTMP